MLFRQLFDASSSTYTYLLADRHTGEALLIDPVREQLDRDLELLADLELKLRYVFETHVHADHVTSAGLLREKLGCQTAFSRHAGSRCADLPLRDEQLLRVGAVRVIAKETPGHTHGDVSYFLPDHGMAFTGDALLIRGCGRTDFQQGDARVLYRSVHEKLFTLPDDTLIYPAHDYKGRTVTTVGEEKRLNPRLGRNRSEDEFVALMAGLNLPKPRLIDEAVPANLNCGLAAATTARVAPEGAVYTADGFFEVSPAWVKEERPRVHLVDVREPAELVGDLGHILDVDNVPLATLASAASRWPRDELIVLACGTGARSGRAAVELQKLGFTRVVSMRGGMRAWNKDGLPVERVVANQQSSV